jgi:hypothetical protein
MKMLSLLCFLFSTVASAASADKLVLLLDDVNEKIMRIEFYTCNYPANVSSICQERLEVSFRDGEKKQKLLTSYTGSLLNGIRGSFSSDLHKIITEERGVVCRMMPPRHQPVLLASYVRYKDHLAFEVDSVELKIVLGFDGCTQARVQRPELDSSYAQAQNAREILTVLAMEM